MLAIPNDNFSIAHSATELFAIKMLSDFLTARWHFCKSDQVFRFGTQELDCVFNANIAHTVPLFLAISCKSKYSPGFS